MYFFFLLLYFSDFRSFIPFALLLFKRGLVPIPTPCFRCGLCIRRDWVFELLVACMVGFLGSRGWSTIWRRCFKGRGRSVLYTGYMMYRLSADDGGGGH